MNRGLNINNANSNLMSTADLGGQKLLGMSGSLTNWINTGNAGTLDSFKKTNPIKKDEEKKKNNVTKFIKITVAGLGIAATGVLLYKNKDKLVGYLRKLKDKFKKAPQAGGEAPKRKPFGNFGEKIKNFFKKKAGDAPNASSGSTTVPPVRQAEETINAVEEILEEATNTTPPPAKPVDRAIDIVEEALEETTEGQTSNVPKRNNLLGLPAPGKESLRERMLKAIMGKKSAESTLIDPEKLPKSKAGKGVVLDAPKQQQLLLEAPKVQAEYRAPAQQPALDIPKTVIKPKGAEQQPLLLEAPKPQIEHNTAKIQPTAELPKSRAIQQPKLEIETADTGSALEIPKKIEPDIIEGTTGHNPTIIPQTKVEPLSDAEMEEIRLLCGYDTAKEIQTGNFEETFEKVKKAIDLPSREVVELLEDKPPEPSEEVLMEARKLAKELQEKHRAKMLGRDYRTPNEVYEVIIPRKIVIGDKSTYPKTAKSGFEVPKLTEPLDQKTIDEVRELCGGLDLRPEDQAICVDDIRPRFDFIEYFKNKKGNPFYERIKAEIKQEKFEDFQRRIKIPKRKKTN